MLSFTSRKLLLDDEPFVGQSWLLITAGTFQKRPFIAGDDRKAMLLESLDFNCYKHQWRLAGFVVLDNHYHLLVQTPPKDPSRLAHIIQSAHSYSAYHWRRDDPSIRSRIWWNFWETPIADRGTLLQNLHFIHVNPARHRVVDDPARYQFSSYRDYLAKDAALVHRWEQEHPCDSLEIIDSF